MDKIIDVFIQRIRSTVTLKEYDEVIRELNQSLRDNGYSDEICQTIKFKQKYIKNKFSDEMNRKKMEEAKENLLEYLYKILFYVYDKEKIIKERLNYENYFNRVFDHKNVNIIIQQPINLL